jgi:hypothetical protein
MITFLRRWFASSEMELGQVNSNGLIWGVVLLIVVILLVLFLTGRI